MELRAVVFGGKFSGKSSLIKSVFGKDLLPNYKRTAQCKKLQGSVCGRELTLVDTPGWWKHFPLSDTAEFLKQELVEGVSLCHPGPHVVLLVIEIDIPFTEKHRKAAEDHLELLGDQIWTHTLVLFTRGCSLDRTIEEHIENKGETLKWLIEKCGNGYHVFGNTVLNDKSQVTQLLEKIEDIVQRNNGAYFQIDTKILEEAVAWKKTVMTKAQSRVLKLQEQKTHLSKEGLRITLLGWVIAGKSSAGNTILNRKVFANERSTLKCQSGLGEVDGRPVTVLDTPSWFKYFPSQYTPAWIQSEIMKSVSQTVTSPHCILLVIPADTSFKEKQKRVIEENMSFLGEQVWRHTIVLFTWGDILGDLTIEQHIESEGEALQWVVEKCENRYHVFNNEERENRVQVTELLQKIDEMVARNSLFQLNTQTSGRIHARQEAVDTQAQITDEHDLQDVVQFVDEEWRRRDKELLRRVSEVKKDIKAALPRRGDRSMDSPPHLSETSSNTETEDPDDEEVSQTEPESSGPVQDEEKSILKLKGQIKEMLDQEWSRREEALMGRFLEMLSELRCEAQSEPTEHDKERSKKKVSRWLQECSEGYASASGSIPSDTSMFAMMTMTVKKPMMMPMMVSVSMVMPMMMPMMMSVAMRMNKGDMNSMSMRPWAHWWMARAPWWWGSDHVVGEELRAVVFGGKFSGKSTLINTVFGKDLLPAKKRTAQCKKLQGSVCGRDLMLVDTPGWWKHFPLSDTAEFLKQELVQGVSLCHPGPHVVLLVIEIDIPFAEKHRKAAKDHLELLGDQIWTHTLVLFTRGRSLGCKTIEEHIKDEGEALQWLIEKCGNRYHVFDNTGLNNTSQVMQLLEKIEDIVQRNNGAYFQIEAKILEKPGEWKKTVMTKAQSRVLKLQDQKTHLHKKELRITLLGWVIAGKSSAGNTILNRNVFANDHSTLKCQSGCGEVDGRPVTVLDTPSWFKYFPSQYTPAWIKSEIMKSVSQTVTSPHCILLVIPADTSFKEKQKRVIEENMSFLGEQVWRHTIVLFTWGDILGDLTIEQHIESEGEALQWVVEKCENRYHVFNNEERENHVQVTELFQKIDEMVARNSFFELNTETFSGIYVRQNKVDTQANTSDTESNLQEIVQFVSEEWRRRDKNLLKRVSDVKKNIKAALPRRRDRSMDSLPDFSGASLNTETDDHSDEEDSQTELESGNVETVQDEAKSTMKLQDQIKELFDREWSRREEALMGRFLEMLSERRYEVLSEPTEEDKERSNQKVFD
ncbi:uncharacterized protein LOC118810778 [Colossoma macropomum]|uniref:uncharacterized protein LOC118810778 n=1 Tax=Colossoma macropomum TaxID=42526 RepID=UPI001864D901|nr:uncharacterized protein LOC118810778 [Colossoma macropomum]